MAIKIVPPSQLARARVECVFCFRVQPYSARSLARAVAKGKAIKCRGCGETFNPRDLELALEAAKDKSSAETP